MLQKHSLVIYKNRPAVVTQMGKKITLLLESGETLQVRPKDVTLIHPGPLESLSGLSASPEMGAELQAAWELLSGTTTPLREVAELAFGADTPQTAWAVWIQVEQGHYFEGDPDAVYACTLEEVEGKKAEAAAREAERAAWEGFLTRAAIGEFLDEDSRYLLEVERLARGEVETSRVMKSLGLGETPESAHAFLLRTGVWNEMVNPHPSRYGVSLEMSSLPFPPLPQEQRRDLTHLEAFAIDDALTENPDDALGMEGNRLWVHIADPACAVLPGSPLDLDARGRAETLHLPETVVHMLPREGIERFGLGIAEVSPAISFGIDLDEACGITGVEIVPSLVRVTRCTYEEVDQQIDALPFSRLNQIMGAYNESRLARGGLSLDLPEVKLHVIDGEVQIEPLVRSDSRNIVREAMLLTGEAAARFALENQVPFVFSTNSTPPQESPGESLAARFAIRRTLLRSQYRVTPDAHKLVGLDAYGQVTSPLRRYLDLVNHQQLRAFLTGTEPLGESDLLERIGAVEAVLGGVRNAERASRDHWTLVYLHQNPDWEGEGILVEKRGRKGLFIIPALALEVEITLRGDPPLDIPSRLQVGSIDFPQRRANFRLAKSK